MSNKEYKVIQGEEFGGDILKIHIIGGSGTGKYYVAEKVSEKFNIPHYDLDNIFILIKQT